MYERGIVTWCLWPYIRNFISSSLLFRIVCRWSFGILCLLRSRKLFRTWVTVFKFFPFPSLLVSFFLFSFSLLDYSTFLLGLFFWASVFFFVSGARPLFLVFLIFVCYVFFYIFVYLNIIFYAFYVYWSFVIFVINCRV